VASDGVIEHPTYGDSVDGCTLDAKTDDAAGEHVHDHEYPVTAQENRFAAKQINAPEAVRSGLMNLNSAISGNSGYKAGPRAV
jgi:hypothetical protein